MQETQSFDWAALEAANGRKFNKKIQAKYPDSKVYCHEPYAMEMYEALYKCEVVSKDFRDGDIFKIESIKVINDTNLLFVLNNGLSVDIDMSKERKYCAAFNSTPEEFVSWVSENSIEYLETQPEIMLMGARTGIRGELGKAHIAKTQQEFIQQITKASTAYVAKVIEKNKGGFLVNVCGVEGFLPGGLAAANKIIDFDSYIGKTIMVMVEDYLQDTKTFVFSNKKYLSKILPTKIAELDLDQIYEGIVTGSSKYGVFIEFEEIFTGLLHTSKMTEETKERFNNRGFRPGDTISFWVKEISSDNRIIITEEDPTVKRAEMEDFKTNNVGTVHNGKVIKNIPFGTLVKIEKDLVGLISKNELKSKRKNFQVGDDVIVSVDSVKKDKIYLSLIDETKELQ
jgi:predicted RNA-binding protein with RPS1 domain